ncbi:glutamate 5-kinase [Candidatus Latescibacterota bacterium]
MFAGAKRIVLKLGTKMITSGPNSLDTEAVARLAVDIDDLRKKDYEIVLVSSGAIAAGMGRLDFQTRPKSIPQLQALASIGQNLLMNAFEKALGMYGLPIAQVLLTVDDIHDRKRYVNVQNTLNELLRLKVLPIINENDSVGTEEVKVGDNDNLSAFVASLVNADVLVLFTDVDGLYDCKPSDGTGNIIPVVSQITPEIEALCGGSGDMTAVGGMHTKIEAARRVMSSGGSMVIANGRTTKLSEILDGVETGTLFQPEGSTLSARRHWIAMTARVRGAITVDNGAIKAMLNKNASLLPKGITGIEKTFDIGDVVAVKGHDGIEIARGVVQYSHREISKIKGHHSNDIAQILGYTNGNTVIHRNDMVFPDDNG